MITFSRKRLARLWQEQAPREGWAVLLDAECHEVTARIPILMVPTTPGNFTIEKLPPWQVLAVATAVSARIIDAEGRTFDAPIGGAA
jgi:hypothetical protein